MSGYYEDTADVYAETRRKARKEHACTACGETISPGHTYTVIRVIYDGGVSGLKRCARCQAMHVHLRSVCDDWPKDELDCGHAYRDEHEMDPPPEIEALAFALPGDMMDTKPTGEG